MDEIDKTGIKELLDIDDDKYQTLKETINEVNYHFRCGIDIIIQAIIPPIKICTDIVLKLNCVLSSINKIINEMYYGEDSRDGQGIVYKKVLRFFEKERRQESSIKTRRPLINKKIFFREKSCKATISPAKNKGWKGKR